jgi:hypothetical protein
MEKFAYLDVSPVELSEVCRALECINNNLISLMKYIENNEKEG